MNLALNCVSNPFLFFWVSFCFYVPLTLLKKKNMLPAIDLHKVLLQSQDTIPLFSTPEKSLRRKYNQFDFEQLETKRIFHRHD